MNPLAIGLIALGIVFLGSGSECVIVSNRQVVFDNKPACHKMMHVFNFRE